MPTNVLEPLDIYGNWVVDGIQLQPPATTMGVDVAKSKFKITQKKNGTGHVLEKKGDKKDIRWDGHKKKIKLTKLPSNHPDFGQNYILRAKITLDHRKYELELGSDDSGSTLKIQLVGEDLRNEPGGTGTAGRGG